MIDHVFILAGGSGTRLWPASFSKKPKQFLEIMDEKSLLLNTVERALALNPSGYIFIITLKDQLELTISECKNLGKAKDKIIILPEPVARNTAPAITAAVRYLQKINCGQDKVFVLSADHLIQPLDLFVKDAEKAIELAALDNLVTIGIKPKSPATGYGYIECSDKVGPGYNVECFKEKPDLKTAESFLEKGNYFWNAGIFAFKADAFWEELEKSSENISEVFSNFNVKTEPDIIDGVKVILNNSDLESIYKKSPSNSIDYAVMEKCKRVAMVKASFNWSDVGSWDEISKIEKKDNENVYTYDAKNNYVYSDKPVALCGVSDLIVVEKNGVIFICKKGESQNVKNIVEELKSKNLKELL